MNKKFTKLTAALALLVGLAIPMGMWGQTRDSYSYTFSSNQWTENGNATLNGVVWTLNMDGGTISNFDSNKGMHFGTNNSTCNSVSISTTGISGTITSVAVEASRGSSLVGGLTISVGGTDFYCGNSTTNALTTSNATYTYTGSNSGTIDILWTKTSGKGAYYIKSITVTYTTGGGSTPSIVIDDDELNLPYTENENGSFTVSYTNFTPVYATAALYSDEECSQAFPTSGTDAWIILDLDQYGNLAYPYDAIPFMVEENEAPNSRPVYMKVEAMDDGSNAIEGVFTITQEGKPQVATPTFNPAAGAVPAGTGVAISCTTEGAAIYYSTNGTNYNEYTAPIVINEAMTLYAKATKQNHVDSEVATAEYTVKGDAVFENGVYSEPLSTQESFEEMTAVNVQGDEGWHFETAYECVTIDGAASGDVDWLITPKMQVDNGKLAISFLLWHSSSVSGLLAVKWSTSNDVNGEWNNIEFEDVAGDDSFHEVDVEITTEEPNVYLAFVYDNTTLGAAGSYSIAEFIARQCKTLTVSNLDHVNTYLFAGTESEMLLEGEGEALIGVGMEVMISVDPYEDYQLASLLVNGDQHIGDIEGGMYIFPMPNGDVAVSASATAIPYYYVSYSTNGIADGTAKVVQGQAIGTLPTATAEYIPAGYEFKGWLDYEYQESDDAPNAYITTAYEPEDDVTLYAVFAIPGESSYTLVGPGDVTEGIYLIGALRSTSATNNFYFADGTISSGDMNTNTTATEIKENSGVRQITTKPTDAQEFEFVGNSTDGFAIRKINTTSYLGYSSNNSRKLAFNSNYSSMKWSAKSKTNPLLTNGIYLQTTNYKVSENSTDRTAIRGYYNGDVYRAIYLFKKVATSSTSYCTSLLTESDPLAVNGYTLNSDGGYKLIATPVYVSPSTVNGMILTGDDAENYDFYYFDEGQNKEEWRNYKKANFNLEPGKGYLYAKLATSNDPYEFTFSGTLYNGNGEVALSYTEGNQLAGWNLIGNPFTTAATLDMPFYKMNSDGDGFTAKIEDLTNTIAAMEGVFVQATAANQTATFTAPSRNGGRMNTAKMELMVIGNRGTVIDNAIVRFDEGQTLEKFMFNANGTKLYFTEGNQDYAIVRSNGQGEMPVNFKAETSGTYTISVNAENTEMNYLHLIDNMTGADIDLLATSSYTFSAKTSDYASRFRLVFSANEGSNENGNETFAYYNGSEWVISNMGDATLQVVDVMGRVLSSETVSGNATLSTSNLSAGVYVMRLINGENAMTQKIVVR